MGCRNAPLNAQAPNLRLPHLAIVAVVLGIGNLLDGSDDRAPRLVLLLALHVAVQRFVNVVNRNLNALVVVVGVVKVHVCHAGDLHPVWEVEGGGLSEREGHGRHCRRCRVISHPCFTNNIPAVALEDHAQVAVARVGHFQNLHQCANRLDVANVTRLCRHVAGVGAVLWAQGGGVGGRHEAKNNAVDCT